MTVHEMVSSVRTLGRPKLEKQLARARARFDALDVQVRKLVKERPVAAVGAALLCGYALGRLIRRH